MSGSSCREHVAQQRPARDGIPLDQDHFVRDAALRQLVVVESERHRDPLAEIAAVVVVAGGDDDAEERRRRSGHDGGETACSRVRASST